MIVPQTRGTAGSLMRGGRFSRDAFTLLELLIAIGLMGILMAATWSMMDVYIDSFERGEARVEEAQIVRSVVQLLTDDLQAAIQDPANRLVEPARGTGQIRRFGLNGTSTRLQIDVLQINPFDPTRMDGAPADQISASLPATSGVSEARQAPELKTVFYTFVKPSQTADYRAKDKPGLTRRELDFETPAEGQDSAATSGYAAVVNPYANGGLATSLDAASGEGDALSLIQLLAQNPDAAETWAPEVVGLRFRYFDGNAWRGSWDSVKQKGLPVAIEASLQIRSLEDVERLRTGQSVGSEPTERRVVVHLPGSPLKKAPAAPRPKVTRPRPQRPRTVTQPRARPPRPPEPRQPAPPSEGWIRSGT